TAGLVAESLEVAAPRRRRVEHADRVLADRGEHVDDVALVARDVVDPDPIGHQLRAIGRLGGSLPAPDRRSGHGTQDDEQDQLLHGSSGLEDGPKRAPRQSSASVFAARLGDQGEQRDGEHEPGVDRRRLGVDLELLGEEPEALANERDLLAVDEDRVLGGQERKEPAQQRRALLLGVPDLGAHRIEDDELVADDRAQPLLLDRAEQAPVLCVGHVVREVDRDDLPRLDQQQRPGLGLVGVDHELLAQLEQWVLDVHDQLAVAGEHPEDALEERPELAPDDVVALGLQRDPADFTREGRGHTARAYTARPPGETGVKPGAPSCVYSVMRAAALSVVLMIAAGPVAAAPSPPAGAPPAAAEAASCVDDGAPFDAAALRERVAQLASVELDGRASGSAGDAAARAVLAARFRCLGLVPAGRGDSYEQPFTADGRATANLVGYLPGDDPVVGRDIILVGAHHDHVGRGHLGANDNASGAVALLAIAQ